MVFGYTITSYYYTITAIGGKIPKEFSVATDYVCNQEASLFYGGNMGANLEKIDEFCTPNDHIIHIKYKNKTR